MIAQSANHPIPQDVTGFKFKLIGNMTIKQFLYLAGGSLLAWIFYASPLYVFIKFPIAFFSFLFGFSLAFVPIEGRPMDTMTFLFLKALFTPNQYVYEKIGGQLVTGLTLVAPVLVSPGTQKEGEAAILSMNEEQTSNKPLPTPAPHIASAIIQEAQLPENDRTKNLQKSLEKEAALIKEELKETKKLEEKTGAEGNTITHKKVEELENELSATLTEKEQLEAELIELQKRLSGQRQVFTPSKANESKTQTQRVKVVSKTMSKAVGLIAPEVPNVLTGVVKDARGNVLPNILVEVKTSEGDAVRAFKTNILGQFASAMPLMDGVYTIEFTDPQNVHSFDVIEITVTSEIILPLEVVSVDKREELRRALFKN